MRNKLFILSAALMRRQHSVGCLRRPGYTGSTEAPSRAEAPKADPMFPTVLPQPILWRCAVGAVTGGVLHRRVIDGFSLSERMAEVFKNERVYWQHHDRQHWQWRWI